MTPAVALFRLLVDNGVEVLGGPGGGTEYSLETACPTCGTGAVQTGPLKLPRFKAPKAPLFSTLDDEILVSAALGESLIERGVKSLGPVVDKDDGEPLPFRQLVPQAVLPPVSARQEGFKRHRPCPTCNRDGYFGIPNVTPPLVYDEVPSSLLDLDLLATWERFGNSRLRTPFRDSVFAAPLYLAGARLADALFSARIKGLEIQPVEVGRVSEEARSSTVESR